MKEKIKKSLIKTFEGFKINISIIIAILLFISIIQNYIPHFFYQNLKNDFISVLFVGIFGGVSAWNPINSYIIAWEMWNIEQNALIISVFLIARVTVWFVQIPAETYYFWKKYALVKNIINFIFSFIWGYIIYYIFMM